MLAAKSCSQSFKDKVMSRVGKHPVEVPSSVKCQLAGGFLNVRGPLGEVNVHVTQHVRLQLESNSVTVAPTSNSKLSRALWGTTRALVANAVQGVDKGFSKRLEINGVGFRAALQGSDLVMQLGFSHDVIVKIPQGIKVVCEKPTLLNISGFSKEQVGEFAAKIRGLKKPEPYKGKGIKYEGEIILRKEGKKK